MEGSLFIPPGGMRVISLSTLHVCAVCHCPGAKKSCSRCKSANYCSKECQKLHWKKGHKACCPIVQQAARNTTWEPVASSREAVAAVVVEQEQLSLREDEESTAIAKKAFDLITGRVGVLDGISDPARVKDLPEGPRDEAEGHRLLKEAAELGNKAAQYQMAQNYLPDGYLASDSAEVIKWIKRAAENNHAEAQITYGSRYWVNGEDGHPQDAIQGVIWMRRALAHGIGEGGHPDPRGHVLSRKSFEAGLQKVEIWARKIYLTTFENTVSSGDMRTDEMRLAADCGILPAIDIIVEDDEAEE